jgi:hypothetical protein
METDTLTTPETAPSAPAPVESVTVPPPASAHDAPAAADDPAPGQSETETTDESDAPKKPKPTFSERISQITAMRKQAEAERSIALREVERLQKELETMRGAPTDQQSFEQQDANRVREVLKEEKLAEKQAELSNRDSFIKEARQAAFVAKAEAALERMPDLLEKFSNVPVSEAAAEIIAESDKAAEIAYYLGNNPKEAHEIARLPAHLQGARIARIEARLSAAPQVRKVSQAPTPPARLSGASSPGVKDPGSMSMEDYAKWRKASG